MKYSELKEVIRCYPTEFSTISDSDIWHKEEIDMYIHIPFCLGKCGFCPFNSMPLSKQNLSTYFSHLLREIELYAKENYFGDKVVRALWIGGGTPSAVPLEYIESILDKVHQNFEFSPNCEYTLETNLHDLTEEYISKVASTKINRLSIGVQSFNDKYLEMMGRTYTPDRISEFFGFIRNYPLNISIDLMYRYPGQTLDDIDLELDLLDKYRMSIDHITLYSLMLFPRLPIYERVRSGKLPKQCSLTTYEKMNYRWQEGLARLGYTQYTSNHFAQQGKKNIYNLDRWGFPQKECVSFGPGAFGQIKNYVYCNEHRIDDYYAKIQHDQKPVQEGKFITLWERISRYAVLGVKNLEIDLKEFQTLTGLTVQAAFENKLNELVEEGLIKINDSYLTVTPKGIAYIIDVSKTFETSNNLLHTQPQYVILDMFNGKRETFDTEVIEED